MEEKKQPKKKEKQKQDAFHYLKLAIAVLFVAMTVLLAIFGYRFGRELFSDEAISETGKGVEYTLQIEPRENVLTIGKDLREHGIIRSELVFFIQSRLYGMKIDPGVYTVSSDQSSRAILRMLNQQYTENRRQ